MAKDWWEDAKVRARKVEGGYESIFNLDGEELVVNFVPFDEIAEILEEDLGRKPTPEEVEEQVRNMARSPKILEALPPCPPLDEEEFGEIFINWNRVRTHLAGKPDLVSDLVEEMTAMAKQMEKDGMVPIRD